MPDRAGDSLPVANMLWVEGRLGPIERACMRSVMRQGHRLVLWHYFPLEGVPEGVELRDGHEVVPRERLFRHAPTESWSLFSNLFRYTLLQQGLGLWLDCDAYLVRPLEPVDGYLMGWDSNGLVAAGVLAMPPDSPVLTELASYFDGRTIPPWLPLRWRLRYAMQRAMRGKYRIETMPWGNLGPHAVTAVVARHGLSNRALPQEALYPWPWQEAAIILRPEAEVLARITPETRALHFYNEMIRGWKNEPAPAGSFLARVQREGA